jgi:MFS family permease
MLGDRHSRRLLLVLSTALSALAIGMAALAISAAAPAWVVFACTGIFSVVSTAYVPAEGALLPQVARTPQELSAANVTHSQLDNLGFLLASIAAGGLMALTDVETTFAVAALIGLITAAVLATLGRDARPADVHEDAAGVLREISVGFRALVGVPEMRLLGLTLTALMFMEGAADVMIVVVALDLLGLGDGSVGWINAGWAVGALVAGTALAVLVERRNIAAGLGVGCLIAGGSFALPGVWPIAVAAYLSYTLFGFGYTFVEVAVRTLLQRLGSDESLARVIGFLETSRLAATALGAIVTPVAIGLLGIRGALIVLGALLPLLALMRWRALRAYEVGAPVSERLFGLVRGHAIFAPLPVDTLEGICCSVIEVEAPAGTAVITQGDHGDRFYLIERGEVEVIEDGVFRRRLGPGDGFGEIALLRQVPRTATVRATGKTRLLALERDLFIEAVTGHRRSRRRAEETAKRWLAPR